MTTNAERAVKKIRGLVLRDGEEGGWDIEWSLSDEAVGEITDAIQSAIDADGAELLGKYEVAVEKREKMLIKLEFLIKTATTRLELLEQAVEREKRDPAEINSLTAQLQKADELADDAILVLNQPSSGIRRDELLESYTAYTESRSGSPNAESETQTEEEKWIENKEIEQRQWDEQHHDDLLADKMANGDLEAPDGC